MPTTRLNARSRIAALRRALSAAERADETLTTDAAVAAIMTEMGKVLASHVGILRVLDKLPKVGGTLRAFGTYNIDLAEWRSKAEYLDLTQESIMVESFIKQRVLTHPDVLKARNPALHYRAWGRKLKVRSAIYVPVGHMLGVLSFYRPDVRPFTAEEQGFCEDMAKVLALAISKSQAEHSYSALRQMSEDLANETQLERVVQIGCESVRRLVGVDVCAIFLKQNNEGQMNRLTRAALAADNLTNEWFADESYVSGQGIIGRALETRKDIVVENDVDNSTLVVRETVARYQHALRFGCKHVAAAPLIGHDFMPLGVIRVMNKQDGHGSLVERGFAASDIELLGMLASTISGAIDYSLLVKGLQDIRATVTPLSQTLPHMELTDSLIEQSFRDLLSRIQRAAKELNLADEVGAVAILPDEQRVTSISDFEDEPPYHLRMRVGGVTDQAIRDGAIICFQDIDIEKPIIGDHHAMIYRHEIQSYAVLPLLAHVPMQPGKRPLGVVTFFSRRKHTYSPTHLNLLSTFVDQAAVILGALWAQRTLSNDAFHRRYERLIDELHDRLGAFEKSIIHQAGLIDILLGYGRIKDARQATTELERDARHVYASLRSLLDQDISVLAREGLEIAIHKAIERYKALYPLKHGLTVKTEFDISSTLDFGLTYDLFWISANALVNAIKNAGRNGTIHGNVNLAIHASANEAFVRVQDNGCGFRPDTASPGYGIIRMKEIAHRRGAKLVIRSRPGGNKTVVAFHWQG